MNRLWRTTACVIALALAPAAPVRAQSPPNVIVLYADDLGIGDVGFTAQLARAEAGLPAISTPNLDDLAAKSLQFTNMYAGAPYCAPSRAALLTGFNPH